MAVRPLSPEVRQKLAKLVPMLASDHDGERNGAVAAIGRTLKAHGLDFHDLTAMLLVTPAGAQPPPPPPPKQPRTSEGDGEQVRAADLIALIKALRAACRFDTRSEGFLDSMLARARRYDVVFCSPKQWRWLCDLVARAGII